MPHNDRSWDIAIFQRDPLRAGCSLLTQALEVARAARRSDSGAALGDPIEGATLYNAGLAYYSGSPASPRWHEDTAIWISAEAVPAYELGPSFTNFVAAFLTRLNLSKAFDGLQKAYLENLLFHPLQNVLQHTSAHRPISRGFTAVGAEVSNRRGVREPGAVSDNDISLDGGQLEILVMDGGEGIAEHFARSKNPDGSPLIDGAPEREWLWLKDAFERHATSKYFERTVDSLAYSPGIGLAAMLAALRFLHGRMDVRCGRMHGFQEFAPGETISGGSLIRPDFPPPPEEAIRGTIIRLCVPLAAAAST